MIQILPVYVPGFLVPFIKKELDGITILEENGEFTNILIEPNSILGIFLRRRIKPDYKVKHYRMAIYTKKISGTHAFSIDILEHQLNGMFKIDLSFSELEELYKFLRYSFMMSFYFYIKGYISKNQLIIKNNKSTSLGIRESIRQFIDEYDLLEYGFSENQMRRLFYNYRKKGSLVLLQQNIQLNFNNFL
jgi:hypothetical protein